MRGFLKGNYETYSSRIDSILNTLENISFDEDKCIFDKIISEFNKKLKSDVSAFVNKPDEFENNIDGFLTGLEDEFVGLADISELAYTNVEDLYRRTCIFCIQVDVNRQILCKFVALIRNRQTWNYVDFGDMLAGLYAVAKSLPEKPQNFDNAYMSIAMQAYENAPRYPKTALPN